MPKSYTDRNGRAVTYADHKSTDPRKMNSEGYTHLEWVRALCLDVSGLTQQEQLKLYKAWENGEDPADHRRILDAIAVAEARRTEHPCTGEHISKLVCAKCGNAEPEKFRFVESIEVYRPVVAVAGGEILVESRYTSGEGYDDGKDPYFECHAVRGADTCLHRTPVPEWVLDKIDWI